MGSLGPGEIIVLALILLIAFGVGAKRIPEFARSLGQAKNEFKRGLKDGSQPVPVEGPCPFCDTDVAPESKFCPGCARSAEDIVTARAKKVEAKPKSA